jgi:hypothetical protein
MNNATTTGAGRTLQAARITGTWAEGSATYATAATITGTTATTGAAVGLQSWTVTTAVQSVAAGTTAIAFAISDQSTANGNAMTHTLSSREAAVANRPQLVVTYG